MRYCDEYWLDASLATSRVPGLETLNGKSILITGATGMICSCVAELLLYRNRFCSAGIRIILAGRSKERTERRFSGFEEGKDYQFLPYDATSMEPLSFCADFVIHGASNASPGGYVRQPVETMLANVLGLNVLLNQAVKAGTMRVLYISSSEVYGQKERAGAFQESDYGYVDLLNPRACYPSAKRAAETLCVSYGAEYSMDTVIVRPGHIYGPTITSSDDRASAQFTRNAVNGQNIIMKSAGTQLRSYCYTMDCASAILAVLIKGENGNAYNISNRASVVSIRDIAEALARQAGTQVLFEIPSDVEKKGYNLMDNSSLDSGKLESLGWSPCFNLEEGVKRTIEYLRNA